VKSPTTPTTAYIADDDPEDIDLLCEVIRAIDSSADLKVFSNGRQVLAQLMACRDEELPHLLILDYSMPELTGPQVLRELGKYSRYSKIAKYVLSTSSASVYMDECLQTGADTYFVKPNSMQELRSIVRKILQRG